MKQYRSVNRVMKRGHIKAKFNQQTNFLEFYRRTSNSKDHTVFVFQIDFNAKQEG